MSLRYLAAIVVSIFATGPNLAYNFANAADTTSDSISGDPTPTIHFSKLPTRALPLPPAPAAQQNSDLPQLLEAMRAFFAPQAPVAPTYGPLSEIAAPDVGETTSGSSDSVPPVATRDLGPQRIVGTFNKYFDTCAQTLGLGNCRFVNMGIMGDAAHRARRSCHNAGEAIDVGPLTCSSGRYIRPGQPMFFEFAKCMAHDSNNELEVIYNQIEPPNMIYRADHGGHMHIQLKNCRMIYGQ